MEKNKFRKKISLALTSVIIFSSMLIVFTSRETYSSDGFKSTIDLLDFSLQELMVLQVTSVTRRSQRQFDAAAAIYTITHDDIKQLGITSIPEALRMVPGMQVAKLNGSTWSVSARGFNYVYANKLLVLIDGRTVYAPLFSGVNWDSQNILMDDIDRIEVIRGPGAAMWGTNAVNGVVNVITKSAEDTGGGLVVVSGGTQERLAGAFRYGAEVGEDGYLRGYVQKFDRAAQNKKDGSSAHDGWSMKQTGFRLDYYFPNSDGLTIQGDLYEATTKPPYYVYDQEGLQNKFVNINNDRPQGGANLLARYHGKLGSGDMMLQSYLEYYASDDLRLNEKRQTWDIEFQYGLEWRENHYFLWGGNYRVDWYDLDDKNKRYLTLEQNNFNEEVYSFFIQESFKYTRNLEFTFDGRMESSRSGKVFQPSARFSWRPDNKTTVWGAVSKAVKTPSLSETSVQVGGLSYIGQMKILNTPHDTMFNVNGNPDLKPEKLTAFDVGFRRQLNKDVSIDVAGFWNFYKDVTIFEYSTVCQKGFVALNSTTQFSLCFDPLNPPPIMGGEGPLGYPTVLGNNMEVMTDGLELSVDWRVEDWWRLRLNYGYINVNATANSSVQKGYGAPNELLVEGSAAEHTFNVFSFMSLPDQWSLNIWLKFMDNLDNDLYNINNVRQTMNLDVKVTKILQPGLELSLVGQNLLHANQLQFYDIFTGQTATAVTRSAYFQIRWTF
ncbi:MAG: TonB-dependent receptor [Candidatus Endonucleobacter sp. (ex Gigantidas childressi)]|nr:TonB-dependent receptor [Candidatus Endonucleobacter sp. (ex Gigantidas childressi)]